MKKFLAKMEYIWDIYIAWFFVNGRKQDEYWRMLKKKYGK